MRMLLHEGHQSAECLSQKERINEHKRAQCVYMCVTEVLFDFTQMHATKNKITVTQRDSWWFCRTCKSS